MYEYWENGSEQYINYSTEFIGNSRNGCIKSVLLPSLLYKNEVWIHQEKHKAK